MLAMVLVILHVLAALKHQFIDRDGVFRRMLPALKSAQLSFARGAGYGPASHFSWETTMADRTPGFDTLALHAGAAPDPATGARITPIYQTTAYVFQDVKHAADLFALRAFGNIYTRIMNPTQSVLEAKVAALEGGTAALAVASGHAAQLLTFHTMMQPGDEFVAVRQLYGGSINQFSHSFKSFGWHVVWADAEDISSIEKATEPQDQGDLHRVDRQSRAAASPTSAPSPRSPRPPACR